MALKALDGTKLPDHSFTPDPADDPDICLAVLHIGNVTTQCGHPRRDHDQVEDLTPPGGRDAV
jgi:hypothetical protein